MLVFLRFKTDGTDVMRKDVLRREKTENLCDVLNIFYRCDRGDSEARG